MICMLLSLLSPGVGMSNVVFDQPRLLTNKES